MAAIANRNGSNMVQHVLHNVNIHFHWNLFIFEFLAIFFLYYIGDHFKMADILKIWKTKSITLRDDLFLCPVSKGTAVLSEFNIFAPLLPWKQPPFWICSTPQKLPHTTVDIPAKLHEVWWKESKIFFKTPFFVSMATAVKFVQPITIFLA